MTVPFNVIAIMEDDTMVDGVVAAERMIVVDGEVEEHETKGDGVEGVDHVMKGDGEGVETERMIVVDGEEVEHETKGGGEAIRETTTREEEVEVVVVVGVQVAEEEEDKRVLVDLVANAPNCSSSPEVLPPKHQCQK